MLARFGIGDLSPEEMKTTPSLRNLNEDPLMSDSLVYFLKPGVTAFGCQKENEDEDAAEEYEDETEYSVRLYGAGMMPRHCQLSYDPADGGPNRVLELIAQKGVVFVNGKQVEDGTVTALKHNDRIIMGNSQVFKVNDPVNAPVGGGPKQLIDWDLAQNELQEAMGTMGRVSDGAPHIHAQPYSSPHRSSRYRHDGAAQGRRGGGEEEGGARGEIGRNGSSLRGGERRDADGIGGEDEHGRGGSRAAGRDGRPQEGDRRLPRARHPPRQRIPARAHPAGDGTQEGSADGARGQPDGAGAGTVGEDGADAAHTRAREYDRRRVVAVGGAVHAEGDRSPATPIPHAAPPCATRHHSPPPLPPLR